MRTLGQKLFTVGAIFAVLFSSLGRADAAPGKGKWGFGDARYIAIQRICHDGLEFAAVKIPASDTTATSINVAVRLFTSTGLPFPDPTDSATKRPFSSYGPLLSSTAIYTMTAHLTETLYADINNDSLDDGASEQFHVYIEDGQLWWARDLPTNTRIVMLGGAGVLSSDVVEDCYLNRTTVNEGATVTIGDERLDVNGLDQPGIVSSQPTGFLPPAEVVYRVTDLPDNGSLRLNNSPLSVGSTFTQADVNNDLLTYVHNSSDTISDSFGYAVATTLRVSVSNTEVQTTGGGSADPAISDDGGRIAFESTASNLIANDSNGTVSDIFVRDLYAGTTTLVSQSTGSVQANAASTNPDISPDGSAFVFESDATNLGQANFSGACLVFPSSTDATHDVYIRNGSSTYLGSRSRSAFGKCYRANGNSFRPVVTNFATYIAYDSAATNLMQTVDNSNVIGGTDDTNGAQDAFRTVNSDITENQSMPNGQSAYGGTQSTGASYSPSITSDGGTVAFYSSSTGLATGDGDTTVDIFVRYGASTTTLVSRHTNGTKGNDNSYSPSISADGAFVAFYSFATNLVASDTNTCFTFVASGECPDIFVRARNLDGDTTFDEAGDFSTVRASVASNGAQANGSSYNPFISAYGRYVAFYSYASNLVSGDTNACSSYINGECPDIFVRDLQTDETVLVSVATDGTPGNSDSYDPEISADGDYVVFESDSNNLVVGDSNGQRDVFLWYRGYTSTVSIAINPMQDNFSVFLPLIQK